jgi:hypothetical protein
MTSEGESFEGSTTRPGRIVGKASHAALCSSSRSKQSRSFAMRSRAERIHLPHPRSELGRPENVGIPKSRM